MWPWRTLRARKGEGQRPAGRAPERLSVANLEVLERSAREEREVVVTWPTLSAARDGQLAGVGEGELRIRLEPGAPVRFGAWDPCHIFLALERRLHFFLAFTVAEERGGCLRVTMPTSLARDSRVSFRVPVLPGAGCGVTLVPENRVEVPGRLVDLSLSGARVLVSEGARPLDCDRPVVVRLTFQGSAIDIPGEVRRRSRRDGGRHYGVLFYNELHGFPDPVEPALVELVMNLERHWIRFRPAETPPGG